LNPVRSGIWLDKIFLKKFHELSPETEYMPITLPEGTPSLRNFKAIAGTKFFNAPAAVVLP
jgi:hypothetical protein